MPGPSTTRFSTDPITYSQACEARLSGFLDSWHFHQAQSLRAPPHRLTAPQPPDACYVIKKVFLRRTCARRQKPAQEPAHRRHRMLPVPLLLPLPHTPPPPPDKIRALNQLPSWSHRSPFCRTWARHYRTWKSKNHDVSLLPFYRKHPTPVNSANPPAHQLLFAHQLLLLCYPPTPLPTWAQTFPLSLGVALPAKTPSSPAQLGVYTSLSLNCTVLLPHPRALWVRGVETLVFHT